MTVQVRTHGGRKVHEGDLIRSNTYSVDCIDTDIHETESESWNRVNSITAPSGLRVELENGDELEVDEVRPTASGWIKTVGGDGRNLRPQTIQWIRQA